MDWLETFRSETAPVITEPLFCCLAEAIAIVESDHGRRAIGSGGGLNEIGYKAVAGGPARRLGTREAGPGGELESVEADFRIFRDRAEQARALLWLLRSSRYYESARALFILAFYSAYAPGRTAGARELLKVFNELAATGFHPGVRPLGLLGGEKMDGETLRLNHAAARDAVRLFAELTHAPRREDPAPPLKS